MSKDTTEKQLDLLIYLLENLPRKICDEMAVREETKRQQEQQSVLEKTKREQNRYLLQQKIIMFLTAHTEDKEAVAELEAMLNDPDFVNAEYKNNIKIGI